MGFLERRQLNSGITYRYRYIDKNGNSQSIKIGKVTAKIAKIHLNKYECLLDSGIDPKGDSQDLKDLKILQLFELDEVWCEHRRQQRTIELNRGIVKQFVKWEGDLLLKSITKAKAEAYFKYCFKVRNYSPTTVNMHLRQLSSIFERGISEHDALTENPFRKISQFVVHKDNKKVEFLTLQQIDFLNDVTKDVPDFNRLLRFYLRTGCRRGEATDLVWSDVNFKKRELELGKAGSMTKVRRSFPMDNVLYALLSELKADSDGHSHVFWNFTGKASQISNKLVRLRRKYDELPESLTPHMLRNTFASHLAAKGNDQKTISTLLGHKSLRTTEIYIHPDSDNIIKSLDSLPY